MASSRCQFGGIWSYQCADIRQGPTQSPVTNAVASQAKQCSKATLAEISRCASLNTSAVFCNSVPNCQLCNIPDTYIPSLSQLRCVYAPPMTSTTLQEPCVSRNVLYQKGECPVVASQSTYATHHWCLTKSRTDVLTFCYCLLCVDR